jgi:hypothetical protein
MSLLQRSVITVLVGIHLVANFWHSGAHTELSVDLAPIQLTFVIIAVLLAPIAAGVLVWTRWMTIGLWLLVLSMTAALLFGVYHHYILVSPDNIAHLPDGTHEAHAGFIDSASSLALLELATALYAAFCLGVRTAR